MGRKLIGGTAYWTTGGSATRRPLTRAAAEGARRATGSLLNLGSSNYLGAATGTSRFGRARAAIQRSVGRSITNLAGEGNRRAIGYQQAEFKRALDRRAAMTDDEKLAHLRMATAIGGASTSLNMQTRDDVRAAILDLALNKGSRKQAEANMSDTEYRDSLGMAMRYAEGLRRGNDLDSGQLDKLNQFKTEAAHVLADIDADELRSHVQSDKFSLRDMSAAAASNPAVVAQLERKMVGDGVSAADRIRRGLEGEGLQNAINSSNSNPIYNSSRATNGRLSLHEMPGLTVNDVASNVVLKNIRVNEIVTDDILGPNRLPVVQGLLQAGKSRDDIRDAAARAEFVDTARALSRTGALNQKQQFVHDMDELHDGTDAHALFTDRGGAFDQARAIAVLRSRPEFAGRLEAQVAASNPAVSGAVAGAINSRQVQDLVYRVRNTNNTDEQQRLTRSLETMVQAMDQHARSISPSLIRGELNAADPELLATYNALRRTSEELNLSTMQRISDS
jgi:hypothetical protein